LNDFTYFDVLKVYGVTQKFLSLEVTCILVYSEELFLGGGGWLWCVCSVAFFWLYFTMMYFGAPLYFFVPSSFALIRCLKVLIRPTNALEYMNVSLLYSGH